MNQRLLTSIGFAPQAVHGLLLQIESQTLAQILLHFMVVIKTLYFVKSQILDLSELKRSTEVNQLLEKLKRNLLKVHTFIGFIFSTLSEHLSDRSLYLIDKIRKNRTLSLQSRRGELKKRIASQRIVTIHVNLTCSCLS